MRDWTAILKERVGALGLEPRREAEIFAELANHLEDVFEEWRVRGLSEEEATEKALLGVCDGRGLRRAIRSAELEEVSMSRRTRSAWLPGLMTGAFAWGLFWLLETSGVQPRILWFDGYPTMFSLPWTLSLPIIGALGAYFSRRAGGTRGERVLAGLFPSVSIMILSLLGLSFQLSRGHALPLAGVAVGLFGWIIVPALALLVGVLPFLSDRPPEPSSSRAAA